MGLDLTIERGGEREIPLDDWKAAVESLDAVDWDSEDRVATNPATRAEIRIPAQEWQAKVGQASLYWSPRWITTTVPWEFADVPDSPEFKGIQALARALDGRVIGNFEFQILADGTTKSLEVADAEEQKSVSAPPPEGPPEPAPQPRTWWQKLLGL